VSDGFRYRRLDKNDAAVLLVDHQTGLCNGIQDQSLTEFNSAVTALAKLAKTFALPTIVTTSAADGPNGPVLPIITELLPEAPVIHRPGEINAWDNREFVAAVETTGRKKLIIAGVSTEVCLAFVAMSAVKAGYDAYAVIDASGTWSKLVQEVAIARMAQAGVVPVTWVAVAAELQADWRNPVSKKMEGVMGAHLPFHANVVATFEAASKRS